MLADTIIGMNKQRLATSEQPAKAEGYRQLRPPVRAVLSVLFSLHLLAVFLAPLTFTIVDAHRIHPQRGMDYLSEAQLDAPPGPPGMQPTTATPAMPQAEDVPTRPAPEDDAAVEPPGAAWLRDQFLWYLDTTYLNHGYGFFSPDPGASYIVRYRITQSDGGLITGRFPDLDEHWPRLRYHRHFMLSSHAVGALPQQSGTWYARHLLKKHDALQVTVSLVRHRLLRREEVLAGKRLNDKDTYEVVSSVTVRADQGEADSGRDAEEVSP